MKIKTLVSISIFFLTLFSGICFSQQRSLSKDWMIDETSYKSVLYKRGADLVLSNGLINRVFREGLTIGLNNLVTGESVLRSIRPEGELTIDNINIPIGGLTGQPIHNYLLLEWLEKMQPEPLSFRYVGYTESPLQKRFDWKPRKEWMTSNPAWPPKGKMLTLRYEVDDKLLDALIDRYAIGNREVIIEDDFNKLSGNWKINFSNSNKINSFTNEGKTGEIMIDANTASFAESALDPETEILIARINPGTDKSTTFGPGIAWVFDKKVIKFYLRTGDNKFGITGAGLDGEVAYPGLVEGKSVYLKMQRTAKNKLLCSYSYDSSRWEELLELDIPAEALSKQLRIGKMDGLSLYSESKKTGDLVRCRIEMVKALGHLSSRLADKNQFEYLRNIQVNVNYEIYDGIPLLCKWISVVNNSNQTIIINRFKSEILAVAEPEVLALFNRSLLTPNITVESDFAHCHKHEFKNPDFNKTTERHVHWNQDKSYLTQIDWLLKTPCLLESYPEYGPDYDLATNNTFNSHRTWELIHDSWDRERKSLQIRKMYRVAAPWVAENPVFMHVRKADNESVKNAIDQCAEVGFELVLMTFGSGVEIEDTSSFNLNRMKTLADYAHNKGISLGGYSLLGSRSIDRENDVIMPPGKEPMFGQSPCIGSEWGQQYLKNLRTYYTKTGQDVLEHDGSYPGDECASITHPGHQGLGDSQWKQYVAIKEFYQWCKSEGIFLNIPDWYVMNGQNKTGMGYRESNWSLPREFQEIIERQNIFDGTWDKTPSMGWMFVPLVAYHGGGPEATIEPLKDHLPHYETRLSDNFGAGVMACYRGPQLYDSPETKDVVKRWVDIYKKHRAIFDSDIIHLRRPDGADWDGFLHVNPKLKEKGLLFLYNPLKETIKRTILVPLYYTGLTDLTTVTDLDGETNKYNINRDYKISIEVEIPAKSCTYYIFED